MLRFLLRRLANYLVLVLLATCIGYFLAATSLHPRANFEGRNPPPPEASVDRQLNELNLNDKTPVVDRFARCPAGGRVPAGRCRWPSTAVTTAAPCSTCSAATSCAPPGPRVSVGGARFSSMGSAWP